MKLRIKGDSLRVRVSPSEVARLLEGGSLEETIYLGPEPGARLTYAVEQSAHGGSIALRYEQQKVTVVVSSADVRRWAEGQDVGMYGGSPTANGTLELAVEKDFACLDKSEAENADTFPNPRQGTIC